MGKTRILVIILVFLLSGCGGEATGGFNREALMEPTSEAMNQQAPDTYKVKFTISAADSVIGDFVVEVTRQWAPLGADRFYNLVYNGFYDNAGFFRVVPNFVAQFGLNGDPEITARWNNHPQVNPNWKDAVLQDEPVQTNNKRGTLSFAAAGPNTRTTQVFINFNNNAHLDDLGFAPFGQVIAGQAVVDAINPQYGQTPEQGKIIMEGNAYLKANFPELTFIKTARIID